MIRERLHDAPKCLTGDDHSDGENGKERKKVAFLDLLLQMHREDKSFTLRDIRDEVDTFMFEAREIWGLKTHVRDE